MGYIAGPHNLKDYSRVMTLVRIGFRVTVRELVGLVVALELEKENGNVMSMKVSIKIDI